MLTAVELKYWLRDLAPQLGAGKRGWTYRFRLPSEEICKVGRMPYSNSFNWSYWPTNEEYRFRLQNVDHHNLVLDFTVTVISFEATWDSKKEMSK